MTLTVTLEKLRDMKLYSMAQSLKERLDKREEKGLSHEEFITLIVDDEFLDRNRRKLERLQKNAKFKLSACLENIEYDTSRGFKKVDLLEFTKTRWLDNHRNIIVTGPTDPVT